MRILMLPEFYPPVIGGLELHAQRLAHALARRGHDVTVCTLAGPEGPGRHDDDGIEVIRIDGWRRHLGAFYERPELAFHPTVADPGVVASLREVLREVRPDVVHAHGWILYSALTAVPGSGAALVATLHDYGLVCARRNMLFEGDSLCDGPSLEKCLRCAPEQYGTVKAVPLVVGHRLSTRRLHGRCDRYLAVSSAVRDAVVAAGANGGTPVEVVPNFVDQDAIDASFGAAPPSWVPSDRPYVLFVGALNAFKGVPELLEVWRTQRPDTELVLAGTPQPDTPTELPPGVRIVQNVPHDEVLAAFRNAWVAVSPSTGPDACPTTVIEAMACGVPVIGTTIGGIPDLVEHGRTGLLVPPGDAVALGNAVNELLARPGLAQRLRTAAVDRARQFTAPVVTDAVESIYESVASTARTPQPVLLGRSA
jgi:glycosyltransferase involved in cell wall biosynthesis